MELAKINWGSLDTGDGTVWGKEVGDFRKGGPSFQIETACFAVVPRAWGATGMPEKTIFLLRLLNAA